MRWKLFKDRLCYLPRKNVAFSIIVLSALLGGCNTMEGVGADVKQAGSSLEHAAEKNKPDKPHHPVHTSAPCPCP